MPREITIKPVLNGFVCQVGCQTVVFDNVRSLAVTVEEYFNHPEETEKRFIEKAVNKMEEHTLAPTPPTSQCESEPSVNRVGELRTRR